MKQFRAFSRSSIDLITFVGKKLSIGARYTVRLFSVVDINNANSCNFSMSILRTITLISFIYVVTGLAFSETKIDYRPEKGYRLLVNGEDFKVKGVAGERYLDILKAYGGNTIRTWSIDKEILDAAHKKGLKVVAGIWIQHMRHGYDYNNKRFIKKQRKEVERNE